MKFNKTLLSAVCGCVLGFSASANAGAVITDGSTSMEKVMGILIESFEDNGIDVTYNPTGSGAGITAALEGRADIGLSSRALKAQEPEKLQGIDVAYDGIVIVVNKANKLTDITTEQIKDVFTGKITNWKDLGGADAPADPLQLVLREGHRRQESRQGCPGREIRPDHRRGGGLGAAGLL